MQSGWQLHSHVSSANCHASRQIQVPFNLVGNSRPPATWLFVHCRNRPTYIFFLFLAKCSYTREARRKR